MNKTNSLLRVVILSAIILGLISGCAPKADKDILYVNLTWHQHQPLYYKDEAGVYSRPWVRVHATKDYLDMAETVAQYEGVNVTFNLTPSLIRQLDDFASNGAKDIYWVLAEIPAHELDETQKRFILERFFDANWDNVIGRFPRYKELLEKRAGTDSLAIDAALDAFSDQDFLDLQVWFNLAWIDLDYLAEEPLKELVEKGKNFSETDKVVLFDAIKAIIIKVIPYHAELQKQNVIEVTTTPYAHPILPLIYNVDLALVGNPSAEMPTNAFSYPQDAKAHLAKSVEMYKEYFGQDVRGLWPGEGSVAQDIVGIVHEAGYQYMQTGEPVLAKSLGIDTFTRDENEKVKQADDLYRPYYVMDEAGNKVAIFFRDWNLSDKVGFTYSGMSGEDAASDLINRLESIHDDFLSQGLEGPHIVSVVLDGENAWEYYDNDGKAFLNALYKKFSESQKLKTITPSDYLKLFPEQRELENLFPGAWFSPNYDTWIGESEEAQAWNYLAQTRSFLADYESGQKSADSNQLAQAFDFMYLAEGSDWFWWYGTDQDSGQDSYFDQGFRELLRQVYLSLDEPVPSFVNVPIIQPQPVRATIPLMGAGTPIIDGLVKDDAWEFAALYEGDKTSAYRGLYYILDKENLYLRIETNEILSTSANLEFYFSTPSLQPRNAFSSQGEVMLGISADLMIQYEPGTTSLNIYKTDGKTWNLGEDPVGSAAQKDKSIELQIPLEIFGELGSGDEIRLVSLLSSQNALFPFGGPGLVQILDMGEAQSILLITDPEGDDFGPGTYTYPSDAIFASQVFDVKSFEVGYDATSLILTFSLYGQIDNGWGSPNGFSVQTFDVYIDKDPGQATGARMLLPGRNAALKVDDGWDYAIWVEGWTPQVVIPDVQTLEPKDYSQASSAMKIFVDPGKNAVVVRVPLEFLGEGEPSEWGYAAALLGQEGYPATGVWRVRDVIQKAEQYRFGGAQADNNHTRIIDLIWPEGKKPSQTEILGNYPSSAKAVDLLTIDDFAIISLMTASE